jgi:hypothetical protein
MLILFLFTARIFFSLFGISWPVLVCRFLLLCRLLLLPAVMAVIAPFLLASLLFLTLEILTIVAQVCRLVLVSAFLAIIAPFQLVRPFLLPAVLSVIMPVAVILAVTVAAVTFVRMGFSPWAIVSKFQVMAPMMVQPNVRRQLLDHQPTMAMMVIVIKVAVPVVVNMVVRVVVILKRYADTGLVMPMVVAGMCRATI